MDTVEERFVAGVFPTDAQAEAARQGLCALGLDDHEIDIGMPEQGRYRIERDESADLGRGAARGVVAGTIVGGFIGIGFVIISVPGIFLMGMNGLALGFLIGAFWGIFFGGLSGMVPAVLAHERGSGWFEATEDGSVAVVVAYAGGLTGAARTVMAQRGATAFLTQAPTVYAGAPVGAVGQYA